MNKPLTSRERSAAVILLNMAATAQLQLWDRAKELEEILGCAVDTTVDLENETVASILQRNEPI